MRETSSYTVDIQTNMIDALEIQGRDTNRHDRSNRRHGSDTDRHDRRIRDTW